MLAGKAAEKKGGVGMKGKFVFWVIVLFLAVFFTF
jgi:hypothetical protein